MTESNFYAIYDLETCPVTFDFMNFLCNAKAYFLMSKKKNFYIIIAPGSVRGFKPDARLSVEMMQWRLDNIIIPSISFLNPRPNFILFKNRKNYISFKEKNFYSVINTFPPIAKNKKTSSVYSWPTTFNTIKKFGDIRFLEATEQSKNYLNTFKLPKNYITITTRESILDPKRNIDPNLISNLKKDLSSIYDVIVINDTDSNQALENVQQYEWNVQLRLALYEKAKLNISFNNGPTMMQLFSKKINYFFYSFLNEKSYVTSSKHFKKGKWKIGQQFPFASDKQIIKWNEGSYNDKLHELRLILNA